MRNHANIVGLHASATHRAHGIAAELSHVGLGAGPKQDVVDGQMTDGTKESWFPDLRQLRTNEML